MLRMIKVLGAFSCLVCALSSVSEAFNLLNHPPPFGNPNGVLGSASFGSISSAGDPRVVQLAVKYLF